MAIKVRRNGAWVDNTGEKKRVNGAWVSNSPYKVMKPTISGVPPFTFKSDGEPLRDLSMSGQTVQASTPSQANPVAAEGVGVRTGNLLDADTVYSAYKQADGTFQGTANNFYTLHPTPFTADDIGKEFTFAIKVNAVTSGNVRASANINGTSVNGNNLSAPGITKVTFTVSSTNDYLYLDYGSGGGNQINISDIMLNTGSTAKPFEPYGYKIPITCGGQTTNIYLGSASTTRRIKKLVLTGEETVSSVTESTLESGSYCFACLYSDLGMTDIIDYDLDMRDIPYPHYVSNHFKMRTNPTQQIAPYTDLYAGDMGANARKGGGTSNRTFNRYIIFCVSGISTVANFKAWLAAQYAAGTPVTIWYVLATPEIAAVNEPLMKIGTYADELTKTGAGVNIPTVSGSNTLTVGTTVQPSEMSIESISQWV